MRAMVLERAGSPLLLKEKEIPHPKKEEVLLRVYACGVCRTDLHILEGDLPSPHFPLVLGHQIVGRIERLGESVLGYQVGDRVGVTWLASTCKSCEFCLSERENLCNQSAFTGYTCDGGYAEYVLANSQYLVKIPEKYDDLHAAPLLCSGVIGYRAFQLAKPFQKIGFYGFGASAHLLIQVARFFNKEVYVFTKPHDHTSQQEALKLGAVWSGGSDEISPHFLDAAIIFAPLGELCIQALEVTQKGGKVISAGIYMSDIPSFPYDLLWGERSLSSVANVTRKDALEFMKIAQEVDLKVNVVSFPLEKANEALVALKSGKAKGSVVLKICES